MEARGQFAQVGFLKRAGPTARLALVLIDLQLRNKEREASPLITLSAAVLTQLAPPVELKPCTLDSLLLLLPTFLLC